MATLLPLTLLLLLTASSASNDTSTPLQRWCHEPYTPEDTLHPIQCPEAPCNTTTPPAPTIALPFLFSLETKTTYSWISLWFYNAERETCGMVRLWSWDTQEKVLLEGGTCDRPDYLNSLIYNIGSSGQWWHVEVVTEGRDVALFTQGRKDRLMTITCRNYLPSYVTVWGSRNSVYGYSAPTNVTGATSEHWEVVGDVLVGMVTRLAEMFKSL